VRRASQRVAYFGKRIGCGVRDQRAGQQAQQPQTRKNRSRAAFSLLPCAGPGTGATGKRKSVCVGSPRVIRPIEVGAPLPVPGLAPLCAASIQRKSAGSGSARPKSAGAHFWGHGLAETAMRPRAGRPCPAVVRHLRRPRCWPCRALGLLPFALALALALSLMPCARALLVPAATGLQALRAFR
jgi:hypothetical protein